MADICALCNKKISIFKMRLDFKDGIVGQTCLSKYGLTNFWNFELGAKECAKQHTIAEFKEFIASGTKFSQIQDKYMTSDEKEYAEKKEKKKKDKLKWVNLLKEFKADGAKKYSHYYFDLKKNQILVEGSLTTNWHLIDFKDVLSYQINENGHVEHKHHGVARAVTGGILAGGVGAIVGATTGGKNNDYTDHLGVILNLRDGSNEEVVIHSVGKEKTNSLSAKMDKSELKSLVSIIEAGMSKANERLKSEDEASNVSDPASEIRKYKKLADDGIITQEEFEAKKKQLLNL